MTSLLPQSIQDERFLAMEAIVNRITEIDLGILAIYNFDTVDSSALPHLIEQFNVAGLRGEFLADTEEKKRNLLKRAIELHRKAGTPWAIREALAAVGYLAATIVENPGLRLDGSWTLNGTRTISGDNPGRFEVILDPAFSTVTTQRVQLLLALINEWKNARSQLLALRMGTTNLLGELLLLDGSWTLNNTQEIDGAKNI